MPRNAEVIRQWNVVREIESRPTGVSIHQLARATAVTTRTIRRDLDALQQAGFPLYDEKDDGKTLWKLRSRPFKALADAGFTLSELCALYFSRTLLECLSATPFHADLKRAFDKFGAVLTPRMRQFLDRLPSIFAAKIDASKRRGASHETVARLLEATMYQRKATMRYHSFSSGRTKSYAIDPYRLVYALGGLYLIAFVPAYGETRTFALERIESLSLLEAHFTPPSDATLDSFSHSLGIHEGKPEPIELEFQARVVPYVKERVWHPSQVVTEAPEGALRMHLDVCNDWALRSWIRGFGPFVRVIQPPRLVDQILDELEQARLNYVPQFAFEENAVAATPDSRTALPLPLGPDVVPTRARR
jgi:predicted DNA-binding transcriptional regulator YafY